MTKNDFLKNLHDSLVGLSNEEIYSHIQYYDEYIENEKAKGIVEEEVVNGLGNPRLIAKTILDSRGKTTYSETNYSYRSEPSEEKPQNNKTIWQKIKKVLIIALVIFIVFNLLRFGFWVFMKIGLPIIIFVFIWRTLKSLFK